MALDVLKLKDIKVIYCNYYLITYDLFINISYLDSKKKMKHKINLKIENHLGNFRKKV